MVDKAQNFHQRVRSIMQDLEVEQFEINHEGLINDVMIINRSFGFRFRNTEQYTSILEIEIKVIEH